MKFPRRSHPALADALAAALLRSAAACSLAARIAATAAPAKTLLVPLE